ncbi:MAG: hypothetical protein N3E49_09470 [Bacteroidia bacterium]|nr:hypothetical protein [Bacteroidia bacterium]
MRNSTISGFTPSEGSHTVPHVNDFVRKITSSTNWVYYVEYSLPNNDIYQFVVINPLKYSWVEKSTINGHPLILPHLLLYAPLTARGVRFRTDDPFLLSVLDDITFAVGRVTISGIKIKRYVLGQFRGAKDFQPNVREIYLRPPLYIDMNTMLGFVVPNVPMGILDALLDVYLLDAYYGPIQ